VENPPRKGGPKESGIGRRIGLAAGIAAFLAIALLPSGLHRIPGLGHRPALAAATAALMAVWWFTEALPIHWTACAPLALYPLLGVYGTGVAGSGLRAASSYVDAYIFLFLGGMMIGAASEECNLHRRVALRIMRAVGASPRRLLWGVLLSTAFVSLWISNTATAVMMMPIGMALLAQLRASGGGREVRNFGAAVMLAVAYGSNVGGIGTKIGTPPNSVFCGWVQKQMGVEISFPFYMAVGIPFVALFLPLVWAVLWRLARRDALPEDRGREVLDRELAAMGPVSRNEKKVLAVFLAAAALWMSGALVERLMAPRVPAFWSGFRFGSKHVEAWVAMGAGLSLLALRALSFRQLLRIPWDTLLLLGGGFALADGIEGGGLKEGMAGWLRAAGGLPLFWQIGLAALAGVGLSAVASNTATANVLLGILPRSLPVLGAATIGASCDFALPAGTPPNAIVFGSGYVRLPTMMKTGVGLDLAAAALITLYAFLYLRPLFA